MTASAPTTGSVHHIEYWVPDLTRAVAAWGWLLEQLGYHAFQEWENGRSWRLGHCYVVFEQSPAMTPTAHDRLRPGLNHLALHAGTRAALDSLVTSALVHGWTLMYPDSHPYAGGDSHCAAYLSDTDGYQVELVVIE